MSTVNGGTGGYIVNVGSAASRLGGPNEFVHYAASKGAVDSYPGFAERLLKKVSLSMLCRQE